MDFALLEFAKDGDLSEIYAKWNEVNREKLSLYYDMKDKPDVPIEKNVSTLFHRVSPCVQFVRESTRTDCLHGVGHLSRFVGDSPFYRSIAVISIFAHSICPFYYTRSV